MLENLFHFLGEVEIVFGIWAGLLVGLVALIADSGAAVKLIEERDFTEPLFVFTIMTVSATRPVITLSFRGPLLGSLITEPAAMTALEQVRVVRRPG